MSAIRAQVFSSPRCVALTVLLILAVHPGSAQEPAADTAGLPARAQAAVDKGITAAKLQDYLLATRYFGEARKLAPQSAQIYLNLGLAESRIPGRELRAISWFGAYLAINPTAPNAKAVHEQVDILLVRSQGTLSRLIRSAQESANHVQDQQTRMSLLYQLPVLWAKAGDVDEAMRTAALLSEDSAGPALRDIASVQAATGDFVGAAKTAAAIQDPYYRALTQAIVADAQVTGNDIAGGKETVAAALKSAGLIEPDGTAGFFGAMALRDIGAVQARAGDVLGLRATASLVVDEAYGVPMQASLGTTQCKGGDIAGAQTSLAAALAANVLAKDVSNRIRGLTTIAEAQMACGKLAEARQFLDQASGLVDRIEGMVAEVSKHRALSDIAEAQARNGDIADAQRTANRMSGEDNARGNPLPVIAEAQAKAGDLAGARKTANRIQNPFVKGMAQKLIAAQQARTATRSGSSVDPRAMPWLEALDDSNPSGDCPLNSPPFLDLAGHLKSLPPSNEPATVFEGLNQTARSVAWAQSALEGLLRKQALR